MNIENKTTDEAWRGSYTAERAVRDALRKAIRGWVSYSEGTDSVKVTASASGGGWASIYIDTEPLIGALKEYARAK